MMKDAAYFLLPLAMAAYWRHKGRPFVGLAVAAVMTAVAPRAAWWGLGWKIPLPVEDFQMEDVQGGPPFQLARERGRPVVLFTWASWCPHTGEYLPMLQSLTEKYAGTHVRFAVVDREEIDRAALADYVKRNNMSYPVYDSWHAYFPLWSYVSFTPTVLLIDRQGRLRDALYGTTQEELQAKVRDLTYDGSPESRMKLEDLQRQNGVAVSTTAFSPVPEDGKAARDNEGALAQAMLVARRYDDLEARAAELRASRARFADGTYRLAAFYDGLSLRDLDESEGPDPFPEQLGRLQAWSVAKSSSAAAHVALGKCLYGWAWRARGSGSGAEVKDAGAFEQRLRQSQAEAETAAGLAEKDPEVLRLRLDLARGLGADRAELDKTFAQALAFDASYERYYTSMAYTLAPRWYGGPGEWEAFARQWSAQRRDPALYALIIDGDSDYYEERLFKEAGVPWDRLRGSLLELEKRYPGSLYRRSRFARLACAAGDKEAARAEFDALRGHYDEEAWQGAGRFRDCQEWAEGGPLSGVTLAYRRFMR